MNILFINKFYPHPSLGGIERVTMLLAKFFNKQGYHCHSIYFKRANTDSCWDYLDGIYAEDIRSHKFWGQVLSASKYDIIINQSHWWLTPILAPLVHERGGKYVFCLHTTTKLDTVHFKNAIRECGWKKGLGIMLTYPLFRKRSMDKLISGHKLNYQLADKVILLCESAMKDYSHICEARTEDNKLDFINNPLSFERHFQLRKLKNKRKVAIIVARFTEEKRLNYVLDVWKKIEDLGINNWTLKLIGDGNERKKLEHQAKKLQLKHIHWEGLQDAESYYEEASIYCMTSKNEGFPMTILESLQMGVVPIVMDSFPAAKELIEDGKNGFLVAYPDVAAFAIRLQQLMTNDKMRQSMALECLRSSKRFTMDEIGKRWMEIIGQMIEK